MNLIQAQECRHCDVEAKSVTTEICSCADHSEHNHTDLAPISVMETHSHTKGEWMFSYRSMFMDMEGLRSGTDRLSSSAVHAGATGYVVAPKRMTMEMHGLGVMYAPNDRVTLMLMLPYKRIEMDHRIDSTTPLIGFNNGSATFTTKTQGIGDVKIKTLIPIKQTEHSQLLAGIGFSLPTGSISEQDVIPVPLVGRAERQLPAPMQLGSGTVDFLPTLTYLHHFNGFDYGVSAKGVLRLHENSHDYRLGHEFKLENWVGCQLTEKISSSLSLKYEKIGALKGTQSDVAQSVPFSPTKSTVTTAYGENYESETLWLGIGAALAINEVATLAVDLSYPVYQDFAGIKLETDSILTIGFKVKGF